jgi:hypothetical protein
MEMKKEMERIRNVLLAQPDSIACALSWSSLHHSAVPPLFHLYYMVRS